MPRRLIVVPTVVSVVLVVAAFAAFAVPIPRYVRLSPGPSPDVGDLITVEGAAYHHPESHLGMALVIVAPVDNAFEWARASLDEDSDLHRREVIIPPDRSDEENDRINEQLMTTSQEDAMFVALGYLGYDVTATGTGAVVSRVFDDTPAAAAGLKEGDVIVAGDDRPILRRDDAVEIITSREPGTPVSLTIEREGETMRVSVGTQPAEDDASRPIVGVSLDTRDPSYRFPEQLTLTIDAEGIGGPSAGLVYTLGIIDALTPGDITGGHAIAATGEVEIDGSVGAVGGLREKAIGVERAGAEYFLVPAGDNYAEAEAGARKMVVVPVKDVNEALDFLQGLRGGQALELPK